MTRVVQELPERKVPAQHFTSEERREYLEHMVEDVGFDGIVALLVSMLRRRSNRHQRSFNGRHLHGVRCGEAATQLEYAVRYINLKDCR